MIPMPLLIRPGEKADKMRGFCFIILLCVLCLAGCSRPQNTVLPRDLSKLESIKPTIEKLHSDERQLLAGYVMRHVAAQAFGGVFGSSSASTVPEGMTVGKAIEEQRKFNENAAAEEAKQKALKVKLQAEQDAAMKTLRDAVTVTLVSKRIETERGFTGITLDEKIEIVVGYKNNTDRDVAGVKGLLRINDLFGDKISAFQISNDSTLKAGQSLSWSGGRSVQYSLGNNEDRKLAELGDDKYKIIWEPQIIVFADGTKLTVPATPSGE